MRNECAMDLLTEMSCVSLGKMLDHAVHSLHQEPDGFFKLFIASGMAGDFERKEILTITGRSGIELSYEVLKRCGISFERVTPRHTAALSKEFHAGSALADLQSQTGLPYEDIIRTIPVSEIISMYENYHGQAVSELPWQMDDTERRTAIEAIKASFPGELRTSFESRLGSASGAKEETHLKEMRLRNGFSQSQLAAAADVPVRTLQQYEQRRKDLGKAQYEYVARLSAVLNCRPEDLIESS